MESAPWMNDGAQAEKSPGGLPRLGALLDASFDPDQFGFPWYGRIEDRAVRAVRSNQAMSLVDAASAHAQALTEAARQVRDLVGPNGRTMPTPQEVEERRNLQRIQVEITDALRAAGSLLDVLGGLVVLFLGLPVNPSFANSTHLLSCKPEPSYPSEAQAKAVENFRGVARVEPPGWIEWTAESRNALVHRGKSMSFWMPVPRRSERRLFVMTDMAPHRVTRQFPHLLRQPDLSDAESVLRGGGFEDVYLREPAQDTLDGLGRQCSTIAAVVAEALCDLVESMGDFSWPTQEWGLQPRSKRADAADAFRGFNPAHPPASDALLMNPRDAKRLLPLERLRRERAES
jgi:hypothetical protein